MEDRRLNDLSTWVTTHLENITQITPLTGDASFRRYVRITTQDNSFIVMDAPPTKESCRAFVGIAKDFRGIGVNTPDVIAQDIERGFLLLTDFGDDLLNTALTDDNANQFYQRCFDPLILIQQQQQLKHYPLVPYNNVIYTYYEESSWFLTWYLQQYRQLSLSPKDLATVEREIHFICAAMSRQPQTVIHRDYHSRNIMLTKEGDLGILDFQDAVIGPIAYDLVS
ncbi:MAG: phosphotransferase, partial [Coxiella sp. (in: Bacteria)]